MKNVSEHLPKQHGTKIAWDYSMLPYTFSKAESTEVISARLDITSAEFFWGKQFQQYSCFGKEGKRSTKKNKTKRRQNEENLLV